MKETMATLPNDYLNEIINKAGVLESLIDSEKVNIDTVEILSDEVDGTNDWIYVFKGEIPEIENPNQMSLFGY